MLRYKNRRKWDANVGASKLGDFELLISNVPPYIMICRGLEQCPTYNITLIVGCKCMHN
jgi:hypothetical protein